VESEEEDWEKKNDFKVLPPVIALVESSNDANKLSEESPSPQISLRPGGSGNFASTALKPLDIDYPPGNWSPENPKGKKMYERTFLLKFQPLCKDKPESFPPFEEYILNDEKSDSKSSGYSSRGKEQFSPSPRRGSQQDSPKPYTDYRSGGSNRAAEMNPKKGYKDTSSRGRKKLLKKKEIMKKRKRILMVKVMKMKRTKSIMYLQAFKKIQKMQYLKKRQC